MQFTIHCHISQQQFYSGKIESIMHIHRILRITIVLSNNKFFIFIIEAKKDQNNHEKTLFLFENYHKMTKVACIG
jgi:hypothetical protein